MYKEKYDYQNIKKELYSKYSILGIEIDCDDERIFRLENPEHLMVFEHIKEECRKKKEYFNKVNSCKFVDGVVFNIMFKELGYSSHYDLVECNFDISKLDNDMQQKSRIETVKECQLCIKNPNIIKEIKDVSDRFPIDEYLDKYDKFDKFKNASNNSSCRYGKSGNYGKWKKY